MLIERLDANQARALVPQLAALLQAVVNAGGTVGFMPPVSSEEAAAYWLDVVRALEGSLRVLLVARDGTEMVGTTQLDLCGRSNGLHRAEIMKLLVHSQARRQGLGRQLIQAIETQARQHQRTTLVLDTLLGEPSEQLYQSLGYVAVGTIPQFARVASGALEATVVYYKLLG